MLTHITLMICVLIDVDDGSKTGLPLFSLTRKVSFGVSVKTSVAWSTVISHIELMEGMLWVC